MESNVITANEAEQETFKIEGSVTTGIRYSEELGIESRKGKYKTTETKWLSAEMTIIIVTLAHNRKRNSPPNEQFKNKFIIMKPKVINELTKIYDKDNK